MRATDRDVDARAVRTSTRSNARPANSLSREHHPRPPCGLVFDESQTEKNTHTRIDRNEWNHPGWIDSTRRTTRRRRRDATRTTYLGRRRRGGFRGFTFSANARGSAGRVRRLRDDGNGTSGKHGRVLRAQSYADRGGCLGSVRFDRWKSSNLPFGDCRSVKTRVGACGLIGKNTRSISPWVIFRARPKSPNLRLKICVFRDRGVVYKYSFDLD